MCIRGGIAERFKRSNFGLLAATAVLSAGLSSVITQTAQATIMAQIGPISFGSVTASADFESFDITTPLDRFPGTPLSSGGLTLNLPGVISPPGVNAGGAFIIWPGDGGVGLPTQSAYVNSGGGTMLAISLAGGAALQQIQFDVGNGEETSPGFSTYIWIRTYNNGAPTGFDFDFDSAANFPPLDTFSIWTDGLSQFDEVRVASYRYEATRNAHNEASFNATSIDNVVAQSVTSVPEPGSLPMLGAVLGILAFFTALRRRTVPRISLAGPVRIGSKMRGVAFGAIAAALMVVGAVTPSYAGFIGNDVRETYFIFDFSTIVDGPRIATVGPGVEFPNITGGAALLSADLTDDQIIISFLITNYFGPFFPYGPLFEDASGAIPDIIGVTVDPSTNAPSILPYLNISFDANSIDVNWLGAFDPSTRIVLNVQFASVSVPESGTLTLFGAGLAGAIVAGARRRNKRLAVTRRA